jgi:formate hydrogenlyase transcriptional activator
MSALAIAAWPDDRDAVPIETRHTFSRGQGMDDPFVQSRAFVEVLKQAELVAPTSATVLVQGETGTGKEVVSRFIHSRSARRQRPFVTINCAAIPAGLLESELFGYQRGAFTGAAASKPGRFQIANGGTILLDEIGDIPLELQPKLLRVLQEQEIERLGGSRPVRIDVRVIAATNRDLPQLVAEKQFRSDLYYRLNVFPIRVPPLRERRDGIPGLARHFVRKSAERFGKRIDVIPQSTIDAFAAYDWPGNVRELENFIDRAVILSPATTLTAPLDALTASPCRPSGEIATLDDAERRHILLALRACNGRVGGPHGAAVRLGVKRTTLVSRMERLGITRDDR